MRLPYAIPEARGGFKAEASLQSQEPFTGSSETASGGEERDISFVGGISGSCYMDDSASIICVDGRTPDRILPRSSRNPPRGKTRRLQHGVGLGRCLKRIGCAARGEGCRAATSLYSICRPLTSVASCPAAFAKVPGLLLRLQHNPLHRKCRIADLHILHTESTACSVCKVHVCIYSEWLL